MKLSFDFGRFERISDFMKLEIRNGFGHGYGGCWGREIFLENFEKEGSRMFYAIKWSENSKSHKKSRFLSILYQYAIFSPGF